MISSFTSGGGKSVNWDTDIGPRVDVNLQSAFSNGRWHHLAVVFSRSANRVTTYFDGIAAKTNVLDNADGHTSLLGAGYQTLVGASGPTDPTYGITGWLDEFAIWKRTLDAGEIGELYLRGMVSQSLTNMLWPPPQVTTSPVAAQVNYGDPATFSSSYTGLFVACQWYFNGTLLLCGRFLVTADRYCSSPIRGGCFRPSLEEKAHQRPTSRKWAFSEACCSAGACTGLGKGGLPDRLLLGNFPPA